MGDPHALGAAGGARGELHLREALRVDGRQVHRTGEREGRPPVPAAPADLAQGGQPVGELGREVGHRVAGDVDGGEEAHRSRQPQRVLELRRPGPGVDRDQRHAGERDAQLQERRLGAVAQTRRDPGTGRPRPQQAGGHRLGVGQQLLRRPGLPGGRRAQQQVVGPLPDGPAEDVPEDALRRTGNRSGQQFTALQRHVSRRSSSWRWDPRRCRGAGARPRRPG
jgi:hypothetical protein